MAYWLLKTEPNDYSYAELAQEGKAIWDGVNNALALKHLRSMQPADLALIYHTGKERRAVGIARVVSAAYPDPALDDAKRLVVDVEAVRSLPRPVTLAEIKQDTAFADFDLVRLPRLSVMPVSEVYWERIVALSATEPES